MKKIVFGLWAFMLPALFVVRAQEPQKQEKADTIKKDKAKKKKDLPLEIGRRVPIKTTEGSWMGLDISPDGKTIVSGSEDETMRIWDALTGFPLQRMRRIEARAGRSGGGTNRMRSNRPGRRKAGSRCVTMAPARS